MQISDEMVERAAETYWREHWGVFGNAQKEAIKQNMRLSLKAALEPQERDGWKDIATAPKDGTWILVSNPKYDHPFVVRWLRDGWSEDDPGPWGTDMGYWAPTHWMPLPAPPHTEGK